MQGRSGGAAEHCLPDARADHDSVGPTDGGADGTAERVSYVQPHPHAYRNPNGGPKHADSVHDRRAVVLAVGNADRGAVVFADGHAIRCAHGGPIRDAERADYCNSDALADRRADRSAVGRADCAPDGGPDRVPDDHRALPRTVGASDGLSDAGAH